MLKRMIYRVSLIQLQNNVFSVTDEEIASHTFLFFLYVARGIQPVSLFYFYFYDFSMKYSIFSHLFSTVEAFI